MHTAMQKKKAFIDHSDPTPLGTIWAAVSEKGLIAVEVGGSRQDFYLELARLGFSDLEEDFPAAAAAVEQVCEYLAGDRTQFDLPIDWDVLRPFQRQVLQATFAIPYGETTTYGGLAQQVGRPRAARAVGRAQATNPMPLVIPCHRVLGSDGKLHGYGAHEGLKTKSWLLELEKKNRGE
jgi:methylated-DNA-[protein]-cysteine S-methyltransferase